MNAPWWRLADESPQTTDTCSPRDDIVDDLLPPFSTDGRRRLGGPRYPTVFARVANSCDTGGSRQKSSPTGSAITA